MKPIKIKPEYTSAGLTNVVNVNEVSFIDIHGEENHIWSDEAAMMKKLIEMLGSEE